MASYPDSVEYLYSLGNEIKSLKFGLDSVQSVLHSLGNPQHRFRSVHVAGTNGKGSTCAMMESALRASGLRTGLFTSPHLTEPTERIRIGEHAVSASEFARAFDAVHSVSMKLLDSGLLEYHPTYFETVTAMAFLLFSEAEVDIAVLETGMGGRLDATNVVMPEVCVLTPIDLDHQQWLGSTLSSIAGEKAGILKMGVPAVFSPQAEEARAVLENRARELGCSVTNADPASIVSLKVSPESSTFRLHGTLYRCPLPGLHQVTNAVTAIAALRLLQVPERAIQGGLTSTRWPGRLEFVRRNPDVLLDGAHNPAGARALASYLREFQRERDVVIVFGAMRDKAVQDVAGTILPFASHVIFTQPSSPRAMGVAEMAHLTTHVPKSFEASVPSALDLAFRLVEPKGLVLVTGSLYLVGEARAILVQ